MDKYERFEAWLRENGAQFDLVRDVWIDNHPGLTSAVWGL
jgi:hypothetical protein